MNRVPLFLFAMVLASAAIAPAAEKGVAEYARLVSSDPNLVAYWPFDGDCRDAKGMAPGRPCGAPAVFEDGPRGGKAVVLAQKRFVTMGPAPQLDLPVAGIELWFKPTFARNPGYNPCIIAKRKSSPETRFSVHIWGDYSCMAFWNGKQVVTFAPPRPIKAGTWYYLVVTCRGDDLKLYLDGLECKAMGPVAGFSFDARGFPLSVGSSTAEGAEHFEGSVDEVAIYSRVLSVSDVERHMDLMGAKPRITREQIAAEAAKRRAEREAKMKERLASFMTDERLLARGEPRVYSGKNLEAVRLPVGGIGTGSIQIDGAAARPVWQIFNNLSQASMPDSFFAIRLKPADGAPMVRALQTAPVGPFAPMKELTLRAEYPFGWFEFQDPALPLRVRMEVFNPLVPLVVRDSAIPCAIHNVTVANPTQKPVEVSLLATQQNAVGFAGKAEITGRTCADYGTNRNRIRRSADATILHMTTDKPKTAATFGDMTLCVLDPKASATTSWDTLDALLGDLTPDGTLSGAAEAGPSPAGQTVDGALASSFVLEPSAERTVAFVLTWHFPNGAHGHEAWGGRGNMYANVWSDALDVAHEVVSRLDDLTSLTRAYHDTLYASNLPRWLIDRIGSQLVVLRSQTCFWTRSGYFGGWEGCGCNGGCCHGNCNHVWQYAQSHARLFPELGRIMREQAFRFQAPDGGIPHRQPASHPAFDGQCGDILGAYREHLCSPDGAWLSRHWPNIKRAMDYTITTWDKDEDGILAGPQWNTLDGNLGGSTSWLGTMYLAALAACEKMALLQNDDVAQRYARIRMAGAKKQDETLFNGEYYIQIADPVPQQDYGNGCHIDQVLGQWWAHQLDLGWLYPPDRVRTAMGSLFRYNLQLDFVGIQQIPRKFVADEDPGMQMITWPKDDRPPKHILYADEVMSGFEYSAAAMMVYAGLLKEGLAVVRAAYDRYDGRLRTGLTPGDTASWGRSGNPFCDDECGKFYARPMSIWSMLLACQGFLYDGPAGVIGFRPIWRPEDHCSFFTAAEGWGLFTQTRAAGKQIERIELHGGRLRLKELVFELPPEAKAIQVTVTLGVKSVEAMMTPSGNTVRIRLNAPVVVQTGKMIEVSLTW